MDREPTKVNRVSTNTTYFKNNNVLPMEKAPILSIVIPHLLLDDELIKIAKRNWRLIKKYTDVSYELIYVDNASPLGKDWMKKSSDIYIRNERNLGNGEGWNQGMREARGDFICLMDNDVFVEKNWIKPLIDTLNEEPQVGIAFPISKNKENSTFLVQLAGFCWVFNKKLLKEVGYIDSETYGIANFEDDDYFMRTIDAGYKLRCVRSSRVKHHSRATCDKMKDEIEKIWIKNRETFFTRYQGRMPSLEELN